MKKLRVGDLFAGIGGFSLGLERTGGFETAFFCEYGEYPQKVLRKNWPHVPIYPDIRELTAERLHADGIGRVDVLTGGYPCQPFSHAGKRRGAEDDRHLWPEMRRLIETIRPTWVIGENVAGHISMGLDDVLSDLGALGYAVQAFVIPACAVNAPHRRDRVWVVAYAESIGRGEGREERDVYEADGRPFGVRGSFVASASQQSEDVAEVRQTRMVAHSTGSGLQGRSKPDGSAEGNRPQVDAQFAGNGYGDKCRILAHAIGLGGCGGNGEWQDAIHADTRGKNFGTGSNGEWWAVEPDVGRVAYGIPNRAHRLKALGNAVIPQIPEIIGRAILRSMKEAA